MCRFSVNCRPKFVIVAGNYLLSKLYVDRKLYYDYPFYTAGGLERDVFRFL